MCFYSRRHLFVSAFVSILVSLIVVATANADVATGGSDALTPSSESGQFTEDNQSRSDSFSAAAIEEKLTDNYKADDIAAANTWVESIGLADWLGPLAPVALSPFFGVTCLSAIALWGPEWATDNALLGSAGPLQNETLFFVFLALTLLTSLPRLTKVSKPFAQATDRLETYAVIVILLAIKVISSMESSGNDDAVPVAMVQLGVVSFTLDTLLAIAMVINVLVINSVKFFFEFLVWLTPIPAVDAIFEFCNKMLCAALMAVYAFSPTIATIINIVLLCLALIVLRWMGRRVRYFRTMVLDPIITQVWGKYGDPAKPELIVFNKDLFGPFAAKSRLLLTRSTLASEPSQSEDAESDGWSFREATWWMPSSDFSISRTSRPRLRRGWVMHSLEFSDEDGQTRCFALSRRYDASLSKLAEQLDIELDHAESEKTDAAVEFA